MQRTRLNTLIERRGTAFTQFFSNPWRRISLILLALLFGFFMGEAISTTVGQDAQWDVVSAALLLLFAESTSRFVYAQRTNINPRSQWVEILNCFKVGITYNLFLEAFKVGS